MNKHILTLLIFCFTLTGYCQVTDASGKKQGYWKKKDDKTDKVIYEGTFKDDKPVGEFKYYYSHDTLRAKMNFKNEGKIAYATLFHMNGKRMAYGKYFNKEIKDSVWTYYDEANVLISRESYKMGKKDGPSFIYLPDGTISEERNYKEDLQHGTFKLYFEVKKVKAQGNYVMGKMEGRASYYFPNGIEVAGGFYKNGQKNGPWIYRNEDGSIKDKELYNNGKLATKKETDAFFLKNKVNSQPSAPAPKKPVNKGKKEENQY